MTTIDDSNDWGKQIHCDEGYTLTRRRNGLLEITDISKKTQTTASFKIRVGAFISHVGSVDLSTQYNESEFSKKVLINEHDITYVEFKNPSAKLKARLSSSALVDINNRHTVSQKRSRARQQHSIQEENDLRLLEQQLMFKADNARLTFQYDERTSRPYHARWPPLTEIRSCLKPPYESEIFKYSKYKIRIERFQRQLIFDDRWRRWKERWTAVCTEYKLQSIWRPRQSTTYSLSNERIASTSIFFVSNDSHKTINKSRQNLFNKTYDIWKSEERMHINVFAFVGLWEPNDRLYDLLLLDKPTCGTYDRAIRNQQICSRNKELEEFRERYSECRLMENEDKRHQVLQINHTSTIPVNTWRTYARS
jgi:hypothetical protein